MRSPRPRCQRRPAVRALAPSADEDSAGREAAPLSPRELRVVRSAAAAMTNQQIASSLGITTGTVKHHPHAALRELDAVSRLDAVAKALASGAITAPVPAGLPDWADAHPDAYPAAGFAAGGEPGGRAPGGEPRRGPRLGEPRRLTGTSAPTPDGGVYRIPSAPRRRPAAVS
ncbi:helix-turn-helix transcriptional regulator [Streptomyces sp. NBC_01433]|uniref:helix-turn-helix domain-containing protein n=1 Tax=Streptomyces sp. NBC_01433 TaxID=2903864 RepID=UPI002250F405|nr:helix-turn-helix transcriptional regulator [Streptomyces sp. NBC_01433]MCX4674352.1 helix-turn-helix transcriptional regulator [Streptomyces sp. NBC_01433]